MYISVWGKEPHIERAALDGSLRSSILTRIGRVNGLAIDFVDRKLFWADLDDKKIESSDLTGQNRRVVVSSEVPHPYGLAQYEVSVF